MRPIERFNRRRALAALAAFSAAGCAAGRRTPARADPEGAAGLFDPPIDAPRRRVAGFGPRQGPTTGRWRMHPGLSWAAPRGAIVRAPAEGRVAHAGARGALGRLVILRHADGYESRLAHLDAILVAIGDDVARGAPVGRVGSSGRREEPGLYFEIRMAGRPVDPSPLLRLQSPGG